MIHCFACLGRLEGWTINEDEQHDMEIVQDDVQSLMGSVTGAFMI